MAELTEAPSQMEAAEAEIDEAQPAAPAAPSTLDPLGSAPIAKWPWGASLLVALLLLAVLFASQWMLWSFIQGTAEEAEREDVDQLKGIADTVQTVVLLLVGSIFGVGAAAGVVASATKAAEKNKAAAETAHEKANENAAAAATNAERSVRFENAARSLATAISSYRDGRARDDSRFLESVDGLQAGADAAPEGLQDYDPELDRMAETAERILRKLREG